MGSGAGFECDGCCRAGGESVSEKSERKLTSEEFAILCHETTQALEAMNRGLVDIGVATSQLIGLFEGLI